ncbi:MAG: head-tail adaptor protein [Sphingopyxis sp.]
MAAGRRDRRVSIQRTGEAVDTGYTTKPGAWSEIASRKAQIIWPKGGEVFAQQGREAIYPATFNLPCDSVTATITTADRIVYRGRAYDLKSVNEIGRRTGIECVGTAGDQVPGD